MGTRHITPLTPRQEVLSPPTTIKALWVGTCGIEIIYPSIVDIFECFRANKLYFATAIYFVVVHGRYAPGCLLPMHRPINGDAARHQQFFRQFFCVQFTFHFDALTISKIGNYPTRLTDLLDLPFDFTSTDHIRPRL